MNVVKDFGVSKPINRYIIFSEDVKYIKYIKIKKSISKYSLTFICRKKYS